VGHGEGSGAFGPRVVLFQHVLTAGLSFRGIVKFSEDQTLYGEWGSFAFWWECDGSAVGGSAGGKLTGRQGLASVTVTAVGQSSDCLLIAQVTGSTVFNSVIVQIYTGVTDNPIPVTAPNPSLMPWTWPSAAPGASSTPYPSATPTASLCIMPMASGMLGPPVPGTCGEPSPSPSPSASPDDGRVLFTAHEAVGYYGESVVALPVGEDLTGHVVHFEVQVTYSSGGASMAYIEYRLSKDGSRGGLGCGVLTEGAQSVGGPWSEYCTIPDGAHGGGVIPIYVEFNIASNGGSGVVSGWVRVTDTDASPSPSPSPSPSASASLGECFYPLPAGELGPLAPRPCASGEAPGSVALGECFYRTPVGQFGPPAPRVCGPGELPGTYGTDGGGTANDSQPECTLSWVVGSTLPRCGGTPGPGMGGGFGDVNWPLSGYSCVGGKPGYLAELPTSWSAFPGLTLDIGLYFQWMGSGLGWLVGVGQNALAYLWDVAADFVVPCPAAIGTAFGGFTDTFRSGPFGTVGGTAAAITGGLAGGPGVPFQSMTVMGSTVTLPLAAIAGAAAPIRPYLVPIVWFAVALRVLSMLATAMKAPGPTGQLTLGM